MDILKITLHGVFLFGCSISTIQAKQSFSFSADIGQQVLLKFEGDRLDPLKDVKMSSLDIDLRAMPGAGVNANLGLNSTHTQKKAAKLVDTERKVESSASPETTSSTSATVPEKLTEADAVLKTLSEEKLIKPATTNVLIGPYTGVRKRETIDELIPSVAVIPERREKTPQSSQEAKFAMLKKNLLAPGGLGHLPQLKAFVKQYPEHNLARLWLVKSQLDAGELADASITVGRPGRWLESDWQVGFWKARIHLLQGDTELAREMMERALTQGTDSADLWVQQAVLEQEENNHSVAVQLLNIALEVDPEHAYAQLNLGYSLERLSRPGAALKAYQTYVINSRAGISALRLDVLKRIELLASFVADSTTEQLEAGLPAAIKSAKPAANN